MYTIYMLFVKCVSYRPNIVLGPESRLSTPWRNTPRGVLLVACRGSKFAVAAVRASFRSLRCLNPSSWTPPPPSCLRRGAMHRLLDGGKLLSVGEISVGSQSVAGQMLWPGIRRVAPQMCNFSCDCLHTTSRPMGAYPTKDNHLCPQHMPGIAAHQIIGAEVAALVGSTFALGTVTDLGRGGLQCSDPTEPLRLQRPWRVEYDGVTPSGAPAFMSAEEVAQAIVGVQRSVGDLPAPC